MSNNFFSASNFQNDKVVSKLLLSINFDSSSSDYEEEIRPDNVSQNLSLAVEKNNFTAEKPVEDIETNSSLSNYSHIFLPDYYDIDIMEAIPSTRRVNKLFSSHAEPKILKKCSELPENSGLRKLDKLSCNAAGKDSSPEIALRPSQIKKMVDLRSLQIHPQPNFLFNLDIQKDHNFIKLHYIPTQIESYYNYSNCGYRFNQRLQPANYSILNPYYMRYSNEPYKSEKSKVNCNEHNIKSQKNLISNSKVLNEESNGNFKTKGASQMNISQYKDLNDFCICCKNPLPYINSIEGNEKLLKILKDPIKSPSKINFLTIILPTCGNIMKNIYGHKVMSLFITHLDYPERKILWLYIAKQIVELGVNKCSQNCISFLLDQAIDLKEQNEIGNYISPGISKLSYDKIGNQILLKIALNFAVSAKKGLLDYIYQNLLTLVYHSEGVCLVKTLVIFLKQKPSTKKLEFLKLIWNDIPNCFCDRNAHHFILCMIENWIYSDYKEIVAIMKKDFKDYSLNKYSSKILIKILCSRNNVSFKRN